MQDDVHRSVHAWRLPGPVRSFFLGCGVLCLLVTAGCSGKSKDSAQPGQGDYAAAVNTACRDYYDRVAKLTADAQKRNDQPAAIAQEAATVFAASRDAIGRLRGPESEMAYVNQTFETISKLNSEFSSGSMDPTTYQQAIANLNAGLSDRYPECKAR